MVGAFKGNSSKKNISYYCATNASDETDLITFYKELSSLVCCIPIDNFLIIDRDMNAQIRKDENNKLCSHNSSNRNGEHLTVFSLENMQTWLNTKLQKKKRKTMDRHLANIAKAEKSYTHK